MIFYERKRLIIIFCVCLIACFCECFKLNSVSVPLRQRIKRITDTPDLHVFQANFIALNG